MTTTGAIADETTIDLGALIVRVAAGEPHAFDALYRAASGRVYALVLRVLRDGAQAEEVTQEVFLQAWQAAAQFDGRRGTALGWLMTLAHRRAVDRVRASQASRDRDLRIGIRNHEPAFDSVSESVQIKLADVAVRTALERLSVAQQRAICLTYYDGMSAAEAAQLVGVPVGTMRTRLRDGLMRLRDELARERGES